MDSSMAGKTQFNTAICAIRHRTVRRSIPGQRQSRDVDDTTEKKRHFEAGFDLKLRNRRQEFRNGNLDLTAREMLTEAAMGVVAEREVRRAAVQSDFIGRFVSLRVAPGKG